MTERQLLKGSDVLFHPKHRVEVFFDVCLSGLLLFINPTLRFITFAQSCSVDYTFARSFKDDAYLWPHFKFVAPFGTIRNKNSKNYIIMLTDTHLLKSHFHKNHFSSSANLCIYLASTVRGF